MAGYWYVVDVVRGRWLPAERDAIVMAMKAAAGLVTLSGGRVLRLRVEPERLARLLTSPRRQPGAAADSDALP